MNLEEFLDADPFEPTPAPAPKKRGRPAATKPKAAAKPRWFVNGFKAEELIPIMMEAARVLEPSCIGNTSKQMRVASELIELIENKKA
jgi:hypothetical protein